MSGRILEIAQNDRLLCVKRGCIEIVDATSKQNLGHIALDDIDAIMITGHGIWLTANLLSRLAELGINVIFSNLRYRPVGILIGVDNNCLQGQRMIAQHDASCTLNKRLWQDIVQTKLSFQASLLQTHQQQQAHQIKILIKNVKSGDPSNLEAQGAKYYWQGLMREHSPDFRREQSADDLINICLNYGYTVLRIATAKQILASGLHTGWGIHHCHPNNTMPLADDLMEPFRVMVDAKVYALCKQGYIGMKKNDTNVGDNGNSNRDATAEQSAVFSTLSPEIKKALVDVIYTDILIQGEHKPFMNYLQMLSHSLVKVYMGDAKALSFPDVKQIDWSAFEALPQFKNTPKMLAGQNTT